MKKIFLFILALCATIMAWGTPKSGLIDGTYYIASKTDLEGFRDAVNGGQYSLNAVQTADINFGMTSGVWDGSWQVPIGTTVDKAYTGTYDGQGYTISNFLIYYHSGVDTQLKTYVGLGLFGVVKGATLKNIHITCATENKFEGNPEDMKVKGCGILCGQMQDATTIEDCSVEGGAYVGTASNTALLCGNDAGTKNAVANKSTINRCWVSGALRIGRTENFGGILGYAYNVSITNCYNLGTLEVIRDYKVNVGGIFGYGNAGSGPRVIQLSNCYNYGSVTDGRASAGKTTKETVTLGAIAGNDKSSSYASVSNLYFLTGSCASAGSGIVSSAVSKSAEEFKSLAASLGDEFVDGTDYPVLVKLTQALEFETSEFDVNTQETYIENTLSGLVVDAYPNFGALTYELAGDEIGTLVDGTANVMLNGTTGTATVTASVAGSKYYEEAETSYTITVTDLPIPTVTFPGITGGKKSVALDVESFTETATVDMEVPIVYSSSNKNVAMVNDEGKVTVLTTGTTEITAKVEAKEGEYKEASATYTLTVTASEASEVSFVEKYGETGTWDNYTDGNKITGTDNIFYWVANNTRRQSGDKIGSDVGLRFRNTLTEGYHLLPDPEHNEGIMEGGIKRIAFTYKEAKDGTGVNLKISAGTEERILKTDPNPSKELSFAANFFVKENTSLKMYNTKDASVVTIGPISIVPYVLYTEKAQTANAEDETYDATTGLINNAPEGDVTFSIVTEDAQATIDEATGVIDMTNVIIAEDIEIKAAYGDAYTTMMLHIDALPEPVITFGKTTYTINEAFEAPTVTVKGETITPAISYNSSNVSVAVVNGQNITFIGTGTTKITASVDATDEYKEASTDAEITVTAVAPSTGNYWPETFSKMSASSYVSIVTPIDGDTAVYSWSGCNFRRNGTDDKVGATQGFRLRYSGTEGYVEFDDNQEGGIKDVYFKWRLPGSGQQHVKFNVAVDDDIRTIDMKDVTASADNILDCQQRFDVKKNAKLKISIPENGYTAVVFSNLYITPYLLYTKKYDEVKLSKGSYVNTDLINNTNGGTITFSAEPAELVEFQQNPTYPGTFYLKGAGEVTITATWTPADAADGEEVTTSYVLKINDKEYTDARFATEGKLEKVLGNTFTNAVTYTKGEGTVEYSSDNTDVAEVDADGKVTIKGIGTATIKAHLDETDNYFAWDGSYILVVRTGVADDNKLVEHFVGLPDGLASNKEYECEIAKWKANLIRRGANDTIGGSGVQGNNIHSTGSIYNTTEIEGGIKYFSFNWKQWATENNCTLKLRAKLGESEFSMEKAGTGPATYEHYFFAINAGIKSNVDIALYNESYNTDGPLTSDKGRITFDAFEIVPYLFYKTKYHKMDVANGDPETWTNTDLINNTEDGTIGYSIEDVEGEDVADIDANGQVTAKSNGKAKVTATWIPADAEDGEVVTTTYEVEVFYSKLDAELAFDSEEISVGVDAIAFSTPTLSNPHELTVKYSSSDETIATVDENSGVVTLKHVAGDVVISATSDETDTYQEGNASYTIHVLPLPTVTFPNLTGTDNIKTVDMDQVPFTETILIKVNEEDVTSSATITYSSDNEEVAVIKDGEVNIIGVGTAYITAKIAQTETYAGKDVYYTLTVEDDTPAEKQWTETFPDLSQSSYYEADPYSFTGKDGVYSWKMRTFRCKTEGNDDKVGDDQGIRIKYGDKSNYIEFDGKQEGGVKRVKFDWRQPGTTSMAADLNIKIDNTVQDYLTLHRDVASKDVNSYNRNVFVKSNTKMTITVPAGGNAIIIGPITITPYLLYTTKTATLNLTESSTYKNEDLINNLEQGDEVTYSIISGDEGIATIATDGTVTATAAGEITIQAKWTDDGDNTITTTYELKIKKCITISESVNNAELLAAYAGQTVDVNLVRSDLKEGVWNSLCLPFDIEKSELGNATVAQIGKTELVDGDVLNIWIAEIAGTELTAGEPYLVLPSENIDLSKTYENKLIVAEEGNQEVDMVTLQGIFSPFAMTAEDETKLFLGQPDAGGHNLFYASENGYLKGMRAYFSINTPSGAPVRVGRIGIQQTPTELGGEADRLNGRQAMKVLRDGQFYIIRETKTYNAQGIKVQ